MKKETLYYTNWNYNAVRLLNRLQLVIENNGGYIAETNAPDYFYHCFDKHYTIHNRTLRGAIREKTERLERLKELNRDYSIVENELNDLLSIQAPPIETRFTTWIYFVLDNVYYELSLNDNPFFPFHYCKIKINDNNQYTGEYYRDEFTKEWLFDCLLSFRCNDDEIKEITNMILNALQQAHYSREYVKKSRFRVSNRYDKGYHYETSVTRNTKTTTIHPVRMGD